MNLNLVLSRRSAATLLHVAENRVLRADADRDGVVREDPWLYEQYCEGPEALPACVERALAQGDAPGRRLWVLYDGLSSDTLSLPTMQIAGVGTEALQQALAFELEALTGMATGDRRLAHVALPSDQDMSRFWISHCPGFVFEQLETVAKAAGSRLAGLLHPAGLPAPLADPVQYPWLRVEYWPGVLIGLFAADSGSLVLEVFAGDDERAQEEIERWAGTQPSARHSEQLAGGAGLGFIPEATSVLLDRGDDHALWLRGWATRLAGKEPPPVPVIEPLPVDREMALTAGIAVAVLIVCLLHFGWHTATRVRYQQELEDLKQTETRMKGVREQIAKDSDRRKQLEQSLAALKGNEHAVPAALALLRHRPARLLETLATARPQGVVVNAIVPSRGDVTIRGVGLEPHMANELAARLERQLEGLGWQVQPPTKKDLAMFRDGGPWEFELHLNDLGLESLTQPALPENPG